MRVLLVHNRYQQAGGEDGVFAAERALLASHGHQVIEHTTSNDAVERLGRLRLAVRTSWSRTTYQSLLALLRRERPDVVHVHNTLPLLSPSVYYAAARARVPVVQTVHNYRLLCPKAVLYRNERVCEDCLGRPIPWAGVAHACYRDSRGATGAIAAMLTVHRMLGTWTTKVSSYIALTEFMRQKLISGGVPGDRIRVKPNFVAPDPGQGDHRGQYALFAGRLAPEKGIQPLLQAWQLLGSWLPLKVLGEGQLAGIATPSTPGVEWLGQQPHERLLALMRDATLLIFPSVWYEGFPLIIAEAFATGLPVVASRLGAMAELIDDRRTGVLFTPGDPAALADAVRWALADRDRLEGMGRAARAEFETKYTAERNYRRLVEIYRSVLVDPRRTLDADAPAPGSHADAPIAATPT